MNSNKNHKIEDHTSNNIVKDNNLSPGTNGNSKHVSNLDIEAQEKLLSKSSEKDETSLHIEYESRKDVREPPASEKNQEEDDDDWMRDDDDDDGEATGLAAFVIEIRKGISKGLAFVLEKTNGLLLPALLLVGYIIYFIMAMRYSFGDEASHRLLGLTILGCIIALRGYMKRGFRLLIKGFLGPEGMSATAQSRLQALKFFLKWLYYGVIAAIIVWTLIDKGMENPENLRSVPGFIIILIFCIFISVNPGNIDIHTIYCSIGLQFFAALYILNWKFGQESIFWIQERMNEFFDNSAPGSVLLFGKGYREHYFVMGALPLVFFTNGILTMLYHLGAMQFVIAAIGKFITFALSTDPVESMSVAGGTFLEGVASVAILRPYLPQLTKSRLFLVLTSCVASLGGAYLAILTKIGVSANHIIGAMIVSAPAIFTVCKLMYPETKDNLRKRTDMKIAGNAEKGKYANILDAIQTGAISMVNVFVNIAVSAFTFICVITWGNSTLTWIGDRVGIEKLTCELIASYLLYPVSLAMGVVPADCRRIAMLFGYRLVTSNLIAFVKLADMTKNRDVFLDYMESTNGTGTFSERGLDIILEETGQVLENGFVTVKSEVIITYALCGFTSFVSIAINMAVLAAFVPKRKAWLSTVAMKSLTAACLANTMAGCFACLFYGSS